MAFFRFSSNNTNYGTRKKVKISNNNDLGMHGRDLAEFGSLVKKSGHKSLVTHKTAQKRSGQCEIKMAAHFSLRRTAHF